MPLAELRDRPLICLPRGTGCARRSNAAAHRRGSGPGSPLDGHLRTLRIVRPEMRARIVLAWQSGGPSSPAAKVLLDRLREVVPKPPAG
ncbi:hypothetical protein [Streptomyces zaomyceticus]|uniref:hypothetical protein n=1 Tax=Streptomyces zaomyceticus TaxID=68286 RepID=UPI00386EA846